MTMLFAPLIEAGLDVDLWRFKTSRDSPYEKSICAYPVQRTHEWSGSYGVHPDSNYWDRPFLKAHFRYEDRCSLTYLTV